MPSAHAQNITQYGWTSHWTHPSARGSLPRDVSNTNTTAPAKPSFSESLTTVFDDTLKVTIHQFTHRAHYGLVFRQKPIRLKHLSVVNSYIRPTNITLLPRRDFPQLLNAAICRFQEATTFALREKLLQPLIVLLTPSMVELLSIGVSLPYKRLD